METLVIGYVLGAVSAGMVWIISELRRPATASSFAHPVKPLTVAAVPEQAPEAKKPKMNGHQLRVANERANRKEFSLEVDDHGIA